VPTADRTCIGCRRGAATSELVRVRTTDAGLELGPGPGRGAWLCRGHPQTCFELAVRRHAFERALRVSIGRDELEDLRARLEG